MRLGLNIWTSSPAWWPGGSSYAADFAADRYMRGGQRITAATAFSLARGTSKYAADVDGDFVPFAPHAAARTAAGLAIEPASTNLLTNPVGLGNWLTTMASVAPGAGPLLGIFAQPMVVTDIAGNVLARLRHPANQSVAANASYALTFWFQAGSQPNVGLFVTGNAGSSRLVLALPSGAVSNVNSSRGSLVLTRLRASAANCYAAQVLWTPNFTGSCEVAIGPGTAVAGDTVVALGAFLEPGTRFTSPMIGAGAASNRAADDLTLHLPAGAQTLSITFANGGTQSIGVAGGDWLVPTDLDDVTISWISASPA